MDKYLTIKRCFNKVLASGPVIMLLTLGYGFLIGAVFWPDELRQGGGHTSIAAGLFLFSTAYSVIASLFNLIYLFIDDLKIRFLLPGIMAIVIFSVAAIAFNDSIALFRALLLGVGWINLLIGYFHYKWTLNRLKIQ